MIDDEVLNFSHCYEENTQTQATWGRGHYFIPCFQLLVVTKGLEAGTMKEYCLLACSNSLLMQTRSTGLGMVSTTVGWTFPH